MNSAFGGFFQERMGTRPTAVAVAPGRIEVIGNHTDYNGGEVMGAAIDRVVHAFAAPRTDGRIRIVSDLGEDIFETRAGVHTPRTGAESWTNYPLGVLVELEALGMEAKGGFDLALTTDLPPGAGLSSSAAVELATARVLGAVFDHELDRANLALLGQRAENRFVGVPCGILDLASSAFGKINHLVHIDCAVNAFNEVPIPAGVHFWIFNTNQKHSLLDSLYSERHRECRRALEVIQRDVPELKHLAQLTPEAFATLRDGDDFTENLRARARHVIEENVRVQQCRKLLEGDGDLPAVGRLLTASHWSSSRFFENSTESLDTLVDLLTKEEGVYGARLSGGGFGGAVMAMTGAGFNEAQAEAVLQAYRLRLPKAPTPTVFHVRAADGARVLPLD